ncbi:hypothetical protein TrCOL_g4816 [Triparma columacea]|uniref:Uncharacterized protein n=1 Tax=Triparma columacea TaxID=722753 RepID=A0A9W7LFX2_9STRA|nr:hypothetical protein TrCOL_g4816 [Triparma columacea]
MRLKGVKKDSYKPTNGDYLLIAFISASYMALWISVGTLIDYYNARYGPLFFLLLNTSFYAPGLPISIMQHRLDQQYDQYYGASATWFFRVLGSMFIILLCSLILPLLHSPAFVSLTVLLVGVATWTAHGALTTITSLYPTKAVGYLQFGFQVPNVFVLALVTGLGFYGLGKDDIVDYVEGVGGKGVIGIWGIKRLERFYWTTSLVLCLGLAAGFRVMKKKSFLGIREEYERGITGELDSLGGEDPGWEEEGGGGDEEGGGGSGERETSISDDTLVTPLLRDGSKEGSASSSSVTRGGGDEELERAVLESIRTHRRVLFFTIFASIFSGSLFGNIPREREGGDNHVDLGQILYFTRLFSDLGGRIATWIPRKYLISSIEGLFYVMVVRLLLLVMFVCYIFSPPSLRSDPGIIALVAVCAFQSGYNAVLVYELCGSVVCGLSGLGGEDGRAKAKAMATRALNMSFQYACAGACVSNLIAVGVVMAMDNGENHG